LNTNLTRSTVDAVGTRLPAGPGSSIVAAWADRAGLAGNTGRTMETFVAIATGCSSKTPGTLRSDGSSSAGVACDTRKPLLAGNTRKPHESFRTLGARPAVQAVMARMAAHSARAWRTGRAADGNLLFNVLIELVDAGDIAIQTVNLVCEFVKFLNNSLVIVLRSL